MVFIQGKSFSCTRGYIYFKEPIVKQLTCLITDLNVFNNRCENKQLSKKLHNFSFL